MRQQMKRLASNISCVFVLCISLTAISTKASYCQPDHMQATLNEDVSQYPSIKSRNAYYEWLDEVLRKQREIDTVFFLAADRVTSFWGGLQSVEYAPFLSGVKPEGRTFLLELNAYLFKLNMKHAKILLTSKSNVIIVFGGQSVRTGVDLDKFLSQREQEAAGVFLSQQANKSQIIDQMNEVLDGMNLKYGLKTTREFTDVGKAIRAARTSLGLRPEQGLNYGDLRHRVQIATELSRIVRGLDRITEIKAPTKIEEVFGIYTRQVVFSHKAVSGGKSIPLTYTLQLRPDKTYVYIKDTVNLLSGSAKVVQRVEKGTYTLNKTVVTDQFTLVGNNAGNPVEEEITYENSPVEQATGYLVHFSVKEAKVDGKNLLLTISALGGFPDGAWGCASSSVFYNMHYPKGDFSQGFKGYVADKFTKK